MLLGRDPLVPLDIHRHVVSSFSRHEQFSLHHVVMWVDTKDTPAVTSKPTGTCAAADDRSPAENCSTDGSERPARKVLTEGRCKFHSGFLIDF
jgi:hypothetical protein